MIPLERYAGRYRGCHSFTGGGLIGVMATMSETSLQAA